VQRQAVETIEAVMATGKSASQSFTLIPEIPRDALGLIASGESAARLPAIFRSLSVHHEEREKASAAMLSALAYPAFLFVLMLLAIGVITFVLVPSIEPIFENAEKPAPTIVSALSLLRSVLLQASVPLGLALIAMGCLSFLTPVRRYFRNLGRKILLRLPIAGKVIAKRGQSQYLSSLSILLENGGTMANALLLSAECNPIHAFTPALLKVRERVTTGSGLTSALRESELFDERILSLISVGDEAGKLSFVCARAAKVLENEAQAMLAKFLSALTPAITIALGLLIGGLVISVMTALLSINDLALQ
jgi:general secretion pathway protein F